MNKTSKKRWKFYFFLIFSAVTISVFYFGFTDHGIRRLLIWTMQYYLHPEEIFIGSIRGNIIRGLTVNKIFLKNTRYLSIPHAVDIKQVDIRWLGGSLVNFEIIVKEGFLGLPHSHPIHLEGTYADRKVDMRLQAPSIDISDLTSLSPKINVALESGRIVDLDMNVSGDVFNPFFTGGVTFTNIRMDQSVSIEQIKCEHVEGMLFEYVTMRQVELKGIDRAPQGSVVRIQDIRLNYKDLTSAGLSMFVQNARLQLMHSDVIVLSGQYSQQKWDINIFSKAVDAKEILSMLPQSPVSQGLKGSITNIDLYLRGPGNAPLIEGKFLMEELLYLGFAIHQSPVVLNLRFQPEGVLGKVTGTAELEGGKFIKSKTEIEILPSRFSLSGDIHDPALDLHAVTTIDKTKIQITVQGTRNQPDLILESEPSLSKEMLLVMVATGQSWKRSSMAINEGAFTPDVVKDFVDYFIFNGQGMTLAQRLGLDSLTISVDGESKGISASKSITNQLSVNYGVEKPPVNPGEAQSFKHQVGGQVQVTENFAVEASKSVIQSSERNLSNTQPDQSGQADIKLKYQTKW